MRVLSHFIFENKMNKNKNYVKREKILNEILHTANLNATEKRCCDDNIPKSMCFIQMLFIRT